MISLGYTLPDCDPVMKDAISSDSGGANEDPVAVHEAETRTYPRLRADLGVVDLCREAVDDPVQDCEQRSEGAVSSTNIPCELP